MTRTHWLQRNLTGLVVAAGLVAGALLVLPSYALVWFGAGVGQGALCNLGVQPWCTHGYGLPEWYSLAAVVGLAPLVLLGCVVAWWRDAVRATLGLAVTAVVLAAVALTWMFVRDGLREHLPAGWLF